MTWLRLGPVPVEEVVMSYVYVEDVSRDQVLVIKNERAL